MSQNTPAWRTRGTTLLCALLVCGLLTACASMVGPRTVAVPQERLQRSLDQRFPLNQRVLAVFDLQLSQPQLRMLPADDRVELALAATLSSPLMKNSTRGRLLLSGRLLLDVTRNAVYLADARVDRFSVDGLDDARQRQLAAVATTLADRVVRDLPLYSFRPEELRYAGVQFVPGDLRVTATGLSATFTPAL
jgi:hypothetical protein